MAKRAGFIQVKLNGVLMDAKGEFTVGYGRPKRTAIIGAGGETQGFKEEGQVAFIEGKITDKGTLDVIALMDTEGATVTYRKANGKTVVLQDAFYAADGNETSGEAEIDFRMEGTRLEEVS